MKSVIPRAVLLVAPVIETLQRQLAEHFPLLRLYEQDDPIAFLREQGENIAVVVTRGDVGVANSVLELLPQAGLIAIFGVGTDAVDLAYARSRQIAVTITSGVLTNDVADLAMGLLLGFPSALSGRSLCPRGTLAERWYAVGDSGQREAYRPAGYGEYWPGDRPPGAGF